MDNVKQKTPHQAGDGVTLSVRGRSGGAMTTAVAHGFGNVLTVPVVSDHLVLVATLPLPEGADGHGGVGFGKVTVASEVVSSAFLPAMFSCHAILQKLAEQYGINSTLCQRIWHKKIECL